MHSLKQIISENKTLEILSDFHERSSPRWTMRSLDNAVEITFPDGTSDIIYSPQEAKLFIKSRTGASPRRSR